MSDPRPQPTNGATHTAAASVEEIIAAADRLAGIEPIPYALELPAEAARLGITAGALRKAVERIQRDRKDEQKAEKKQREDDALATKKHAKESKARADAEREARAAAARDARQANQPWPEPYYADKGKIWFERTSTPANPEPFPMWICDEFRLIAETTDEHGEDWGFLLRWTDRDNRDHQAAIPRRLLHTPGNEIAALLDAAGLACGTGIEAHGLMKQLLSRLQTPDRKLCVPRGGWHHTHMGYVYVLPTSEAYGPGAADVVLQKGRTVSTEPPTTGTLDDWGTKIASLAVDNYRLGLAISAAFAAPLLAITGDRSGGIHLYGMSQTGKTTALGAACSVWGQATTDGYMKTWRATSNGMEGIASDHCDGLLPLDEIGMAESRDAGEMVYTLFNETGKARAARDGSPRPVATWRVLMLSTGEVTLGQKMAERGIGAMTGQEIRLINIPSDAGSGYGIFNTLHQRKSGAALSNEILTAARGTTYGTAGREFVNRLVQARAKHPNELLAYIAKRRDNWLATYLPQDADGQIVSVAQRFSLIAAAGALAQQWDIVPWAKDEADRAASNGFKAWLDKRGGDGAGEDIQAIRRVRAFIEAYGESRFTRLTSSLATKNGEQTPENDDEQTIEDRIVLNRAGWRREKYSQGKNVGWQYMILPEVWANEVCKGIDPTAAAKALCAALHLEKGDGANLPKKHRIPHHGTLRLYTVGTSILH